MSSSDADPGLDALDRGILHALRREARHASSSDVASSFDVSASTVRNRIRRLESTNVIRGYHADVDTEAAGYQPFTGIVRTAPIPGREELAAAAAEVPGVAEVQEVTTGEANCSCAPSGPAATTSRPSVRTWTIRGSASPTRT